MKFPKEIYLDNVDLENGEEDNILSKNVESYFEKLEEADVSTDEDYILAKYQLVETYKVKIVEPKPTTKYFLEKITPKKK